MIRDTTAKPVRPATLYRYRPATEHAFSEIREQYLWFTHPRDFNDPLECSLAITRDDYSAEEMKALEEGQRTRYANRPDALARFEEDVAQGRFHARMLDTIARTFDEHNVEVRQKATVCCFSATFDHLLMWAHYASGHRGVCIAYDSAHQPINQVGAVHYVDEIPIVDVVASTLAPEQSGEEFARKTLLAKVKCWEYEREWRLIAEAEHRVPAEAGAIRAILVGLAADFDSVIEPIARLGKALNIPVYKGMRRPGTFEIVFRSVERPDEVYSG